MSRSETPSTQPPKGMRDFLPQEMRRREHVLGVVREVYRSYGFEPLETSACERLEILTGKYGDEGDQLLFRLLQRGEKLGHALAEIAGGSPVRADRLLADMALRYDLTVPLARVVAEHQGRLPRIFKRYQIQPVWRADRPQKSRYREFLQCDVDTAGSASRTVEVETTSAVSDVLARLGFDDFAIRVSHRGVLAGIAEAAGVPPDLEPATFVTIDKMDKIGRDGVLAELAERGVPAAACSRIGELLGTAPGASGAEADLARVEAFVSPSARGRDGIADLRQVLDLAKGAPSSRRFRVDPSLARGLSYYTGVIFEIAVPDLSGSIGSGGRYDGLVGMFLGRDVPACGASLGVERILDVLAQRGLAFGSQAAADVMVARFDAADAARCLALAARFRAAGLRALLHDDPSKLGNQFKDADDRKIPVVALQGPVECERGTVSLKDLRNGEKAEVPEDRAADWVRERLRSS